MKNTDVMKSNTRWSTIRSVLLSIAALSVGGLVGAGAGLLYAPRSGRATRALIRSQGVALREKLAEDVLLATAQARSQVSHVRRDARYRANEIGVRLQDAIEERQHALKEAVGSISIPFQQNGR